MKPFNSSWTCLRSRFRLLDASLLSPSPLRNTTSYVLRFARIPSLSFSTSARRLKTIKVDRNYDQRVRFLRYHLFNPELPRPLRFSRLRALRHWTIHRAWMVFKHKQRAARERELEKQYGSMYRACEELRLMDENGVRVTEGEAQERNARGDKNVGRLYRIAMEKKRVWGPGKGFPIEYARMQTDYPSREGWSHGWTR